MPDLVVHNVMGDNVLRKLPDEISSNIDSDAFHVGVLGPDPFFFYWFFVPPLRHGIDERGPVMHHQKCGAFLRELGKRCCAGGNNDRDGADGKSTAGNNDLALDNADPAFSYFCGFLCHYALDSTVHPYINMLAAKRVGMHTAIERKLDRIALSRRGQKLKDIPGYLPRFPDIPEIRQSLKAVYGWDDDEFRKAYVHMKWFQWLVKDERGILSRISGSIPVDFVKPSAEEIEKIAKGQIESDYKSRITKGRPVPVLHHGIPGLFAAITGKNYVRLASFTYSNHYCDELEMPEFDHLQEIAEEYAVKLITAAHDYRAGRITERDLAALIGNRSYSGGPADE